jgi:hypothetical protein
MKKKNNIKSASLMNKNWLSHRVFITPPLWTPAWLKRVFCHNCEEKTTITPVMVVWLIFTKRVNCRDTTP